MDQSRAVFGDGLGRRSDLRSRHRLLHVRAAVPAARPGRLQRHRRREPAHRARPLSRRCVARRARVLDSGPRPPRRARGTVPPVGRLRLPARQARAVVQLSRDRDGRQLHRPERSVPGLRHPHDRLGACGGPARRWRIHPDDLAARADDRGLVPRIARRGPALSGSGPAVHGDAEPVRPGTALHRQQHRDDASRLRYRRLEGLSLHRRRTSDAGTDRA